VGRRIRVGHCHDDGESRAVGRGGIPLVAVDHVVAAVRRRAGLQHHRVGAGHVHLGHGKAGAYPARDERLEVFFLLLGRAVFHEYLDVARVRGLATKGVDPGGGAGQGFAHQAVFHQVQAHAAVFSRMQGSPELHFFHHLAFLGQDRLKVVPLALQKGGLQGKKLLVHELVDEFQHGLHFFRYGKIHDRSLLGTLSDRL
jgi:hypothetical protein